MVSSINGCVGILAITSLWVVLITLSSNNRYVANASDPSPLQDFCVGIEDPNLAVVVNGLFCKNPKDVTSNDFVYHGFNKIGDTDNLQGGKATLIDALKFPALNTLGVSIAHVDFAPYGLNTPHYHPHASEAFTVIEGSIYVGFIGSEPGYKLYSTVLKTGDIFAFPQGLIHFQQNLNNTRARAVSAFGSQHPARVDPSRALFGSKPAILDDVLIKAYQVDEEVIEELRSQFYYSLKDEIIKASS